MWLFLAFLLVPLIEIALFIQVGGAIGLWPTLVIVILTAMLGTVLVRGQGLAVVGQLKGSIDRLQDPTEPLVHGAMILFSGALLLTPGFFTDAVGFALLVPGIRSWLFGQIRQRVKVQTFGSGQRPGGPRPGGPTPGGPARRRPGPDDVVEGSYEVIDEERPSPTGRPSGWTKD